MGKSEDILNQYELIKNKIVSMYNFEGLSDEEIYLNLKKIASAYQENWSFGFERLIIRYYYEEFLKFNIYNDIEWLCGKNLESGGRTDSLALKLLPHKKLINEKNQCLMENVLERLSLKIVEIGHGQDIVDKLTGIHVQGGLDLYNHYEQDIFREKVRAFGDGVSKFHHGFEFNYDADKWSAKMREMEKAIEDYDRSLARGLFKIDKKDFEKNSEKYLEEYKIELSDYLSFIELARTFFDRYDLYTNNLKDISSNKTI